MVAGAGWVLSAVAQLVLNIDSDVAEKALFPDRNHRHRCRNAGRWHRCTPCRRWSAWRRWVPLVCGVYPFVAIFRASPQPDNQTFRSSQDGACAGCSWPWRCGRENRIERSCVHLSIRLSLFLSAIAHAGWADSAEHASAGIPGNRAGVIRGNAGALGVTEFRSNPAPPRRVRGERHRLPIRRNPHGSSRIR